MLPESDGADVFYTALHCILNTFIDKSHIKIYCKKNL